MTGNIQLSGSLMFHDGTSKVSAYLDDVDRVLVIIVLVSSLHQIHHLVWR